MSEQIQYSSELVETVRHGTIKNLQMIALNKPDCGLMDGEGLMEYLDVSGVVKSIATAVHVNNLQFVSGGGLYDEAEPDSVKKRAVAQGFHCGFILDRSDKKPSPDSKHKSIVYLQGIRNNRVDPDRRGPFDYAYRLDLPVRNHLGLDFRLDPNGGAKVYCASSALNLQYNSRSSRYYIGGEDLTSVLQEAIGDLIDVVQNKKYSKEEKRDMPVRLESFMQIDSHLGR